MGPMDILAIDPGDAHTGVAIFGPQGTILTYTLGYGEALDHLNEVIHGTRPLVVIEEFRLYPWLQDEQGFSDFPTSQLIGALKWIARCAGAQVKMQPATIKVPMAGILEARGVNLVGGNRHEMDAELHGWKARYDLGLRG